MSTPKLYITGCPKSGTHFTAKLLQSCGLKIGHEITDADGIVSWYNKGVPYENDCIFLHQVRNPLDTISSIRYISRQSFGEMHRTISFPGPIDILEHSMYAWYHWNLFTEKDCVFTYQLENIEEIFDILDLFGVPYEKINVNSIPRIGQTEHKLNDITWDKLFYTNKNLTEQIIELAERYEYTI